MSYLSPVMNRSSIQCPAVNNQLSPMIEAVQVLPRKVNRTRNAFPSSPSSKPKATFGDQLEEHAEK